MGDSLNGLTCVIIARNDTYRTERAEARKVNIPVKSVSR